MNTEKSFIIFHKNHPLDPTGANAGAETATISLARALVTSQDCKVVVLACLKGKDIGHHFSEAGVDYLDLGDSYDIADGLRRAESLLGTRGSSLIAASYFKPLEVARLMEFDGPSCFICHEPGFEGLGIDVARLGDFADHIVALSTAQRQLLVQAGCHPERICLIPNGVDLELFAAARPEDRDYRRLIFVGALVLDKGVHFLIEAFAELKTKYHDLSLDIYGSAGLWGRDLYFDLEQVKTVPDLTFHGAVSQHRIAKAFQTAGLLVVPSLWFESFGLVALEAQTTGLPTLCSGKGGMRDIVIDNVTGRLLGDISTPVLVEQIDSLLERDDILPNMSRSSLELVRGKFSWQNTAEKISCLLQRDRKSNCGLQFNDRVEQDMTKENKRSGSMESNQKRDPKIGLLTTYNQSCGLATYAGYLTEQLKDLPIVFLAEIVSNGEITAPDDSRVFRCWKRGKEDFSKVWDVIVEQGIDILHINCHYRFFEREKLSEFLSRCRQHGVRVVAQVHNPYTIDRRLEKLCSLSDAVVVHTQENKLEVVANKVAPDKIWVIEHGIHRQTPVPKDLLRSRLGIAREQKVVVCFGFVQVHKGIDEVIVAINQLQSTLPDLHLYIVGGVHLEDVTSADYFYSLKRAVQEGRLEKKVHFIEGFVPEEVVDSYLQAADVIVMNYRSQYFEASGAVAKAMGSGTPVITSIAPPFARMGSSVFHITSGYPLSVAIEIVLSDEVLWQALADGARSFAEKYCWENVSLEFRKLYLSLPVMNRQENKASANKRPQSIRDSSARTRILMLNRPNARVQPGGDTVVMERICQGLIEKGCAVDIDLDGGKSIKDYDLVHIFNFATPQITEDYARRAKVAGVPYVVTTMYEDRPRFFNQMLAHFEVLREYVVGGQENRIYQELILQARNVAHASKWDNTFAAENAACLIATGQAERSALRRDYNNCAPVEIYRLGCDIIDQRDGGELFTQKTGLRDFVLCVGRLETRKNQLMLLRALEESDLTVVFAGGGFTYQPEYEALCQKFKRRGKTFFLDKLSRTMLVSAYEAASVHVLPSWYELPGIVSMEAARLGTNVVVSDYGTPRDYFGDRAYYCQPDDVDSIYNAVVAAYYAPTRTGLESSIADCTWENAASRVMEIYNQVLPDSNLGSGVKQGDSQVFASALAAVTQASRTSALLADSLECSPVAPAARERAKRQEQSLELCYKGDECLRRQDYGQAEAFYRQAVESFEVSARGHRSLGVVALMEGRYEIAEGFFNRALELDPSDSKAMGGIAAVCWNQGSKEEALELLVEAIGPSPSELSLLPYLVDFCYSLQKLDLLETKLRVYVQNFSEDLQVCYCLAGCLYKKGKYQEAGTVLDSILKVEPEHPEALELIGIIKNLSMTGRACEVDRPSQEVKGESSFGSPFREQLDELEFLKRDKQFEQVISKAGILLDRVGLSAEDRGVSLVLRAESFLCLAKLEDAERDLGLAHGFVNVRARVLSGQGVLALLRQEWDLARGKFEQALVLDPRNDAAHAGRGVCAAHQGDLSGAMNFYLSALSYNPENMRALLGVVQLGYGLERIGDIEKVVRHYLEIHPADLSMIYSLAGCLYAQGRLNEARDECEKILIFDSGHQLATELISEIDKGSSYGTG